MSHQEKKIENGEIVLRNFKKSGRKESVSEVQRHPSSISGGEKERVAIVRAIVNEPPVLLADEPTGNLDSVHGQEVMEMLQGLNDEGTTIVMVTHDPLAAAHADRVVFLEDGRIAEEGGHQIDDEEGEDPRDAEVAVGDRYDLDVQWSDLTPGIRYFGAIQHYTPVSTAAYDITLISVAP